MPTTNKPRSGKEGRIAIGAINANLKEWDVSDQGEYHDTTHFESVAPEGIVGWVDAEVSVRGDFDAGSNFLDDPPGLYAGNEIETVKLYTSTVDDAYWDFPTATVVSARMSNSVRGVVSFEATFKGLGTYTDPAGSV